MHASACPLSRRCRCRAYRVSRIAYRRVSAPAPRRTRRCAREQPASASAGARAATARRLRPRWRRCRARGRWTRAWSRCWASWARCWRSRSSSLRCAQRFAALAALRAALRTALRTACAPRLAPLTQPPCHVTRRTFQRIVARQSTEDFAGAPYVVASAQCATWVLYCLLTPGRVAPGVTNGLGLVIEVRRARSARAGAFAQCQLLGLRGEQLLTRRAARAERLLHALPALRARRRQARRLHAGAGRRCRRRAAFPRRRVSSHAAYALAPTRALAPPARSHAR
jgi:hypothetical protein